MLKARFRSDGVTRGWQALVYPALAQVPAPERDSMLRRARDAEFDFAERIGMIASVAFSAYLLEPIGGGGSMDYVIQYLLALPLLAVLIAPWLVRRTRRGLAIETARLHGGAEWNATRPMPNQKTIGRHSR